MDFLNRYLLTILIFLPTTGAVNTSASDSFTHSNESASPGYYAVTLSDYGVRAELTATTRVGLHRYTFPAVKPAHVLVDLRSAGDRSGVPELHLVLYRAASNPASNLHG